MTKWMWWLHTVLSSLVAILAALVVREDLRAQARGSFISLVPETIATPIVHGVLSTFVLLALRSWFVARPAPWIGWLSLAVMHALLLPASGLTVVVVSSFLDSV